MGEGRGGQGRVDMLDVMFVLIKLSGCKFKARGGVGGVGGEEVEGVGRA